MNLEDLVTKKNLDEFKAEMLDSLLRMTDRAFSESEWMTVRDLSVYLKISESKIRQLKSQGKLPYKKVDGTILFYRKHIDSYLLSERSD